MDEPNPGERWAPIPGYEGSYEVSDLGRIRALDRYISCENGRRFWRRGRALKPSLSNSGYLCVKLSLGGKQKSRFAHSLVLSAFAGACPDGMQGCHDSGDRLDNRLVNLRWDTPAGNARDKIRHGTDHRRNQTHCLQGHLLAAPNLVPWKAARGHRACRACTRAHDYGRYCKAYGRPFSFRAEADEYYRRIMAGDTANRHKTCPRGHRLEQPNLAAALAARGKLACLACRRASNNAQDAKRAGRPFDFQAVADRHYERIMAGVAP